MSKVIHFFCLLSFFGPLMAQEKDSEKEQITARLEQFTKDLNNGKADTIASYWTTDGEIITPITGQAIEGKSAVAQYLQTKIQHLQGKQVTFDPKTIVFTDPNSATVEGVVQIFENGKLVDQQARRVGLIKENGTWDLDSLSEIQVDVAPSSYEHLKELEWLLGNWKDKDEHVAIQLSGKWDKFKNFIIQTFAMDIYGVEALEGVQIIGWDPIEKKIRSWVYDSDGGFGTGTWSKIEGGFSVKLNYVLNNGMRASSTNIYSDIKDKSYSYSSVDRKVGDQELPDIQPAQVLKE